MEACIITQLERDWWFMPAYGAAIPSPPRTLTAIERTTLLKVTSGHRDGFRDHVMFAVALGTGLRKHEIAALDAGDVLHEDGRARRRIALRTFKRSSTEPATQEVFIPDSLWYKPSTGFLASSRGSSRPRRRRGMGQKRSNRGGKQLCGTVPTCLLARAALVPAFR